MSLSSFLGQYFHTIGLLWTISWWWAGPIVLFWLFKILWFKYTISKYLSSLKWIVLELKPPRNLEKSPRIMEQFFQSLHGSWSTPNLIDYYVKGRIIQTSFSCEILGVNGEMHFYVRCERYLRDYVESLLYAQYPEMEIQEAEDYTKNVPTNIPNNEWTLFGWDYKLAKDDAYPIRTYKYFQEEVTKGMIDPLSTLADVLSNINGPQQAWLQLIITPVEDAVWKKAVKKVADKLASREEKKEPFVIFRFFNQVWEIISLSFKYISTSEVEFAAEKAKEEQPLQFRLTPGEQEILKSAEASLDTKAFKTKFRFVCIGKKESFDWTIHKGVLGATYQFGDPNLNSFVSDSETKTYANYFYIEPRLRYAQRKIFNRYRDRDFDGPTFMLNSEELATVFHMPDMSVMSPAISRVEAKKGGAPLNLPVE